MRTLAAIFDAFDGPSKVAQAIGVSTEHAAAMKRRNSIPVGYWPALVMAAQKQGIEDITYETLTHLHQREAAE